MQPSLQPTTKGETVHLQRSQLKPHADHRTSEAPVLVVGALELDMVTGHARLAGCSVQLSNFEFRVMSYLASRPGCVVSISELLQAVWNYEAATAGASDQVRSCIKRLRQKVELDPRRPTLILTAYRSGYFVPLPGKAG